MTLEDIHLRKALRFLASPGSSQRTLLRRDIREEREVREGGGGDFYSPFWADAKNHAAGNSNLHETTEARVEANYRRRNLYPPLRDGFLQWWQDQTNRWGNQAHRLLEVSRRGAFDIAELGCHIKVHNILTFEVGTAQRLVYPYWFHDPALGERYGRIALACLAQAFPDDDPRTFKVLDVERGQVYSGNELPVAADDFRLFVGEMTQLVAARAALAREME